MSEGRDQALPTIADVRLAAGRIAGRAVRTPLLSSPGLDERIGGRVLLKCENLQRTGSFKFRGAYNAIAAMSHAARARGVVAVSSGNHAQGVAEAARLLGVRATIVMPTDSPRVKRLSTGRRGGRIIDYDRASHNRDEVAARYIAEHGGTLVHPFDDPQVIAGQGTIGLEIVADCAAMAVTPDVVAVPCGGGGLAAGIGLAVRDVVPGAEMVLVEPADFDDYGRSLRSGNRVVNARQSGSICDALLVSPPGPIGFALNRENRAETMTVSDEEALAAIAFAWRELKLVVEPGGAVALAALLARRLDGRQRSVVVVISGGNIDDGLLHRALALPG